MKWIGKRISFEDISKKTTVIIIPENNVLINVLMGAWLGMWYCIGFVVIWSLFELKLTEQENIILYVFLVFWMYYAFRISKSYLWILFGKEMIMVNVDAFHVKNH